jgi:hypothetical protein
MRGNRELKQKLANLAYNIGLAERLKRRRLNCEALADLCLGPLRKLDQEPLPDLHLDLYCDPERDYEDFLEELCDSP